MNLQEAKELYIKAKDAYYNSGKPIITDAQFDRLENWITKKDPTWSELKKTGILPTTRIGKKTEVKLPFFMPSLNKFYPEEVDKMWKKLPTVSQCVYMAKLDGCSVLLEYENGKPTKLTTRGNGEVGKDISFFIPYLNLRNIEDKNYHGFRCEAIIKRDVFRAKWMNEFDNARNMVSGLLNRTDSHPALKDIDFVVLGEYDQYLLDGLTFAKRNKLNCVDFIIAAPNKEQEAFAKIKQGCQYETDGVVVTTDDFIYSYTSAEKPKKGIFAFKINPDEDHQVQAEVVKIIWQDSAFGRLIPKVQIKPVMVQGAKVTYVTCHNAQWMEEHKIGPGAIIKVIRSGEVIPKIVGVVKPADHAQLPDCEFYREGVHFYQTTLSNESYVKKLERAINAFGISEVKYQTLKTIREKFDFYFKDGIEPLAALLNFLNMPRLQGNLQQLFGNKAGTIIANNLLKITQKKHTLIEWLLASCVFDAGIGKKRLQIITKYMPLEELLNKSKEDIVFKLSLVNSIGSVLANQIAEGLVKYNSIYPKFVANYAQENKESNVEQIDDIFKGFNFSFTGYRNKDQEYAIQALGGNIINFGAKTDLLLYKVDGKKSSKIAKAGNKAITWEQLVEEYPNLEQVQLPKKNSLF